MNNEQHPPTPMTKEQQSIWLRYLRNQLFSGTFRLMACLALPAAAVYIAKYTNTNATYAGIAGLGLGLFFLTRR
jgi:hypothetical protein